MAYGVQVWSDNGRQWVDVVQPSWVVDMRVGMSGSGTLSYAVDPRFQLKIAVLSHTRTYKQNDPPSFSVSGGKVVYHLPAACSFIVFMEAK